MRLLVLLCCRYVQSQQTPLVWENDSENVRLFFESYLRENNISADDARSLREAQVRGGATYKIQTGAYTGLDQNVKVREIIAIKGLKTSADERKYAFVCLTHSSTLWRRCPSSF